MASILLAMAGNREVEIKFAVDDIARLSAKLEAAGFRLVTERTHEANTLYDLPSSPLRRRGALLRLRNYGSQWTLTYKAKGKIKQGKHKSRTEIETRLQDGVALAAILQACGFRPGFAYEKFRSEWADSTGHVVIDETPIGNFAEIEGPPQWIDDVAQRLGVSRKQYITLSYGELFLLWKRKTGSRVTQMVFAL